MRFQLRQEHLSAFRAEARAKRPEQMRQALQAQGVSVQKDSPSGDLLATDARGYVTRLAFEPDGLPARLVTPSGAEYRFSHDREGRLAGLTYPGGERIEMEHDGNGHIRELRRPGLLRYHLKHDATGRLLWVQYPDENAVKLDYDLAGNLVAVTDRAGARIAFDRGAEGRLRSITDALGRKTVFETTAAGELQAVLFPDGSVEQYAFDPDANVAVITARDGNEIIQELDAQQAIKRIEWPDGSWAEFELDRDGNLVSAQNAVEKISHTFEASGNPSGEETSVGVVSYSYDSEGRLLRLTTFQGDTIEHEYDPDGRIACIRDWNGRENKFAYAVDGTLAEIHYGNGLIEKQKYARVGRLQQAEVHDERGRVLSAQRYAYDMCEHLTQVADIWGNAPTDCLTRHLEYDAENRLLNEIDAATDEGLASFAYDAKGNLVQHNGVPISVGLMDEPVNFGAASIDYDDLGNMRRLPGEKGEVQCEFAADGTLRQVQVGKKTLEFAYDAFGRRVLKTDGRSTWRYGWAGHQLLWEEFQKQAGAKPVRRDYLFIPNTVTPIAFREAGRTYWLQSDARGAIIRAFDESGNVVWRATYDSFGQARLEIAEVRQPWRLAGQYYDDETGLHYNFARYYSPYVKSYLSRDPSWFQFEATNYSYARNDPWNRADPFGAIAPLLVGAGAVALGAAVGGGIGYAVGGPEGALTGMEIGAAVGAIAIGVIATAGIGLLSGVIIGGAAVAITKSIVEQSIKGDDYCMQCAAKEGAFSALFDVGMMALGAGIGKLAKGLGKVFSALKATGKGTQQTAKQTTKAVVNKSTRKSIRSLKKRLAEHKKKLTDYKKNPEAYDNKEILQNAPSPEIRQRIIDKRIKHLEDEAKNFQKQIDDLEGSTK